MKGRFPVMTMTPVTTTQGRWQSLLAVAVLAAAGWLSPTASADDKKLTLDQNFIKHAAKASMFEVKASQYVAQQSSNEKVRELANHILRDHNEAIAQLKVEAQRMGVEWPDDLMDSHDEVMDDLKDQKGAQLDTAYVFNQVGFHAEAIAWHRWHASHGTDNELKKMSGDMASKLEEHQGKVKDVADALIDKDSTRSTSRE